VTVACVTGVLIGGLYTMSPMTVWFGVAMVSLFAWAGRGLGRRERSWLLVLLGAAVAFRLLALAGVLLLARPVDGAFVILSPAPDGSFPVLIPDEWYFSFRARLVRYMALGIPLGSGEYLEANRGYGQTAVTYVRAYLELVLGEAPHAIRLFYSALYLSASVALYRTVRPTFGALAALGGLAVVLFLPSLFVWSIAALKEAPYLCLAAVSACTAVTAARRRSMRGYIVASVILGAALLSLKGVRPGAELIVGGGIIAGLVGAASIRRPVLVAVVVMLSLVGGGVALQNSGARQVVTDQLYNAAVYHMGYVRTPGWNYKVLDAEFYIPTGDSRPLDPQRFTLASTARYLLRGTASFFFVPLPWQVQSRPALAYLAEQLAWNLLIVLAVIGVIAGLRLDATLTLVLVGVIAAGAVLIGITSGNVGTLIRHRSMAVVLVPWLSSLGLCELLTWAARFRTPGRGSEQTIHDLGETWH
jgi:hypothetical protein